METPSAPDTYLTSVFRDGDAVHGTPRVLGHLAAATIGAALFGLGLAAFSANGAQLLASGVKLPILLLGSALLCFPTFHLVQVSQSAQPMTLFQAFRGLSMALAATGTTWAALAPPVLFLVVTSQAYDLAKLIAVCVGGVGGLVGMLRFRRVCRDHWDAAPGIGERAAFLLFAGLFAVVGGQLAWVLRPFIGSPFLDFTWLRALGTTPFTTLVGG